MQGIRAEAGTAQRQAHQGYNSALNYQADLKKHIMSLDEVEIKNPRSPHSNTNFHHQTNNNRAENT